VASSPSPQWARTITRLEIPVLLAISPVLLFPTPGRLVVLIVVPLLLIAARLSTGHAVPRTPVNVALYVLLAMVGVSLFVTIDVVLSLGKVCGMILGTLVFWAIVRWTTTADRLQFAALIFILAGIGLAASGLLGANWDNKFPAVGAITSHLPAAIRGVPGAEGGFNTNAIGGCLILFVPVQVALLALGTRGQFPGSRRRWSSAAFWLVQLLLLIVTAGTLVLTESRTSWIAFIAGAGVFLFWHNRWTRLAAAAGVLAVAVWVAAVGVDQAMDSIISRAGPAFVSTFDLRMKLWMPGVHGIQDRPLTGFGMNVFRKIIQTRYPGFPALPGEEPAHVHNHLLQAALDLGVPGLVAYLALWLLMGVLLVQVYRRSSAPIYRSLASGLGVGLIGHFIFGMTDVIPLGAKVGVLFWLTVAFVVSLHQVAVTTKEEQSSRRREVREGF
jgi:putative inorganic carbon (HCO3(-)) transporter